MWKDLKSDIYVPAARTGAIQFFNSIIYMRNQLLRDIIRSFGGREYHRVPPSDVRRFLRSLVRFPLYLEDFYDLILGFLTRGEIMQFQKYVRALLEGSIDLRRTREFPSLVYVDRSGARTDIEAAGSGVVASFPIILGMMRVAPSGMLIVEEPEAHLEPARQMMLLELLCRETLERKVKLVITTHSDFIVKKILGLVAKGTIKNSKLGLQYFDRRPEGFTRLRSIEVSRDGEAEQPLFNEAMKMLLGDFAGETR